MYHNGHSYTDVRNYILRCIADILPINDIEKSQEDVDL